MLFFSRKLRGCHAAYPRRGPRAIAPGRGAAAKHPSPRRREGAPCYRIKFILLICIDNFALEPILKTLAHERILTRRAGAHAGQPQPGSAMTHNSSRLWTGIFLLCALTLAGCQGGSFDDAGRYVNRAAGFSFIPPKGWTWHEGKTGECDYVAGAYQGGDRYVYVCVNEAVPGVLTAGTDDENCAQLVKHIQNRLHGKRVECRPSHIQRTKAYSAMFYREVVSDGRNMVQIVNQTAIRYKGRLLMMNATATAAGADAAKSVFTRNLDDLAGSAGSFWLH
jgi:hypothetical protein